MVKAVIRGSARSIASITSLKGSILRSADV